MLKEKLNLIINAQCIIVKKTKNDFISGIVTSSNNKKNSIFYLSWGDNYIYLRIKGDDELLLKIISEIIGTKYIKSECNHWFNKTIMYSWHKTEEEAANQFRSLQFACAINSGLFSFLGWQNVKLIQITS